MALSVGFIGVGNMGNPMAGNVLKAGFSMTVFDTNPKAMENLIQAGAKRAASAKEVVERLRRRVDLAARLSGRGGHVPRRRAASCERAKPGTILIDLSSVLPSTPRMIEPVAKARGVSFLEAPVSGGVTGARAGTLAIMVGGDPAAMEKRAPGAARHGPQHLPRGAGGRGQHRQGHQQHDGVREQRSP